LQEAHLHCAVFVYANLQAVDFRNAGAGQAFFIGSNLRDTDLRDVSLKKADLTDAYIIGANFRNADLSDAIFTNAKYDKTTKWPDGFDPVEAGAVFYDEDKEGPLWGWRKVW
jgi:uncharacterized protein YjbI with pentapeptide repeats